MHGNIVSLLPERWREVIDLDKPFLTKTSKPSNQHSVWLEFLCFSYVRTCFINYTIHTLLIAVAHPCCTIWSEDSGAWRMWLSKTRLHHVMSWEKTARCFLRSLSVSCVDHRHFISPLALKNCSLAAVLQFSSTTR